MLERRRAASDTNVRRTLQNVLAKRSALDGASSGILRGGNTRAIDARWLLSDDQLSRERADASAGSLWRALPAAKQRRPCLTLVAPELRREVDEVRGGDVEGHS